MVRDRHVLMVGEGRTLPWARPFVEGALVTAEVVEQGRSRSISFKKRRRQNSKRIKGHRQHLTTLRIAEILTGGAKPSAKKKATPAKPKADESAEAEITAPVAVEAVKQAPAAEKKAAKPKAAKTEAARSYQGRGSRREKARKAQGCKSQVAQGRSE